MSILTLRPNGIGSEEALYPGYGDHDYTKVDEEVADDATTYVTNSSSSELRDLYTLPNHSTESGTINSITIYIRGQNIIYGNTNFYPSLRSGSTTIDGSVTVISQDAWTTRSQTWTTNPVTSAAWTWAEIDALEIGCKMGQYGGLTQVYVEIDYTETAGTVIPVFMNQYRQRR